jgi:hypothetical protein
MFYMLIWAYLDTHKYHTGDECSMGPWAVSVCRVLYHVLMVSCTLRSLTQRSLGMILIVLCIPSATFVHFTTRCGIV